MKRIPGEGAMYNVTIYYGYWNGIVWMAGDLKEEISLREAIRRKWGRGVTKHYRSICPGDSFCHGVIWCWVIPGR